MISLLLVVAKRIKEKLFIDRKNAYLRLDDAEIDKAYEYNEGYKDFLNRSKTEREAVRYAVAAAEENGFKEYENGRGSMSLPTKIL